jgi:hypothetical protein
LLSPDLAPTGTLLTLDVRLAELNVRIEAPENVLAVLEATLAVVPRCAPGSVPDVTIAVLPKDDVWEIRGLAGSLKVMAAQSALPQVAGAVVTSIMRDVAVIRDFKAMRATVIAKGDRALAMIGDDWESTITLAAHLHGRGWSYVGSDNALLDPLTLDVISIQKSLYVNSSAVGQFPANYRRAVEASPWYVTPQGISFYAVDPHGAGHKQTWSATAVLAGVIVIDGAITTRPSLESLETASLQSERFTRYGIDWGRIPAVDLRLGGFVDSCDLVEHWFESISA